MPPRGRAVQQRWNLLGSGQDSYAGQNAQDPKTSRKIQSWIPEEDGQLHRELAEPAFSATQLSGPVVGLYEFDQNYVAPGQTTSVINRYYFAAARTNTTVGTKTCNLYQLVSGVWTAVTAVGTLLDAPMCVTQENNFFLSDGQTNWLFNGSEWVQTGIDIPLNQPAINVPTQGTSQVFFDSSGVLVNFYTSYANSGGNSQGGFHGTVGISNPINTALYPLLATATKSSAAGASLLFNPPEYNGTTDPNVQPMQWATLSAAGAITGYTVPWSGATQFYQMTVQCNLVIPAAGKYAIQMIHDDGAIFGFGAGGVNQQQPVLQSSTSNDQWTFQTVTAEQAYPVLGGTSKSGAWQDTFIVEFLSADTYPLEIDYCQFEANQTLMFKIVATNPTGKPSPNILPSTSPNAGSITAALGRYYWYTNADQTTGVATESSSSPIGSITGQMTGGTVTVYQQPGLFSCSSTSTTVSGSNSTDSPGPVAPDLQPNMVGKTIYINGTKIGTIAAIGNGVTYALTSVTNPVNGNATYSGSFPGGANNGLKGVEVTITGFSNSGNNISGTIVASTLTTIILANGTSVAETHSASAASPANSLTLAANALATETNKRAVICDPRCTHWNIYASESDGSKIGQYLTSVPVTTMSYTDASPFISSPSTLFLPIYRPVRNDQPPPSRILEVHKVRQWRRQETDPALIYFTANEEVTSGNNGDPAQCCPGNATNTVSDMINEVSFPDQSAQVRSLTSHLDSLYMFSEKACYPLYGTSVDDFSIAQVIAFALGSAGRFAVKSTPNGLVFISYDKKAFLFPTSLYSSYIAQAGASTSALIEIGKPLRNVLSGIASSRLDEVVTCYYHYGIRDWWVVCFPASSTQDTPQTWVYDFNDKGWFQLQRGLCSVSVFEVSTGDLVLVGGDASGNTWVIDDQTGTYSSSANLPQATWQPALINFGDEEIGHVFRRLELEFDSAQLAKSIQITVWLDPVDVNNPGKGKTLYLRPTLGANRYSAFMTGPAVCKRMLLQIVAPANTYAGVIRGIMLFADSAPGFLSGANRAGGV